MKRTYLATYIIQQGDKSTLGNAIVSLKVKLFQRFNQAALTTIQSAIAKANNIEADKLLVLSINKV